MSETIRVSRELMPCPFCASADIDNLTINQALAARYRRYMMLCRSCGCCSDKHKTKKEARMHCNTRAILSQPAEQQDESWQAGYDKGRQDGANRRPDDVKQLELRNSELQSELNEKRENICRLLIELDAVPRHGHCNHGPEKTCGRCTADEEKSSNENIVEVPCSTHPDAPHGFNRTASHCEDRYVFDCEGWVPTDEGNA